MPKKKSPSMSKSVETFLHLEDKRKNIPTAEHSSVMGSEQTPKVLRYPRNPDLDPQLVWRGKDEKDWSDLVVPAPPLYIQEKVHPKALIDDLLRVSREANFDAGQSTLDLFSDFNGIPKGVDKTEFYQHDQNWTNRMILGDSLQVMASLAEREGLRGKVQCIYFDPPYGIKFNSNFQWSTTSRDVKDGKADQITREPEQVKAFRDTWRDGIHSYLTYLRDRLTVARDLLTESGSIFVQIGDENAHRVRTLMDEVFGENNHVATIAFLKTSSATSNHVPSTYDSVIWFSKNKDMVKFRQLLREKSHATQGAEEYAYFLDDFGQVSRLSSEDILDSKRAAKSLRIDNLTSQSGGETTRFQYSYQGKSFFPGSGGWKTNLVGMNRLEKAGRLYVRSTSMNYVRS
jgi:adenine-specific DNA-methyltransferase